MKMVLDSRASLEAEAQPETASPFFEGEPRSEDVPRGAVGFMPWAESLTPFVEGIEESGEATHVEAMLAAAFAELRDEAFDEALANLAAETEQFIADRLSDEVAGNGTERERVGDAHLASVRFEAENYLDSLEQGIAGRDLESLSDQQLDELLDSFDPTPSEVTPAGEEFIGGLIRKAKSVVKFVANAAKTVGGLAGKLIGPVLQRLRGLINPLLRRVLSFAIGRLPAPLQAAARTLATRITSETSEDEYGEATLATPVVISDVEALAESFDAALAEAVVAGPDRELEGEFLADQDTEGAIDGRELEVLAEARGALIDRLRSVDAKDVEPAVEQFVPALLGALRLGINLVGRPKVVSFLAQYLAKLIGRWVGPDLSSPLSTAIVDTGLRLVSLEQAATEERGDEAVPAMLATVIEDAVRRFAENEGYVFEDEGLMQLAAADAFGQAVSTYFPGRFVRSGLQQAPSIGGAFVPRRPRSLRTYRKYSRVPEVELTAQIADALPSFGGLSVGAVLRAAGARFPLRARVHIYEAAIGTTLPRLARMDRTGAGRGRGQGPYWLLHPLTPAAAGLLLREPHLGVQVPDAFIRSRHRIAVGQRFYYIEPIGPDGGVVQSGSQLANTPVTPSQGWAVIDLVRSQITVALYLSEAEAQAVSAAIRAGRGGPALLNALTSTYTSLDRSFSRAFGRVRIVQARAGILGGALRAVAPNFAAALRRRIRRWLLPAIAGWTRTKSEEFVRASAHPANGVTVLVRMRSIPDLDVIRQTLSGRLASATRVDGAGTGSRAAPTITVTVVPGKRRP